MKLLLWLSGGESEIPGGHRVQFEQTYAALLALGLDVAAHLGPDLPDDAYDVVHLFSPEVADVRAVRERGAKAVLSTIYRSVEYRHNNTMLVRPLTAVPVRGRAVLSLAYAAVRGRQFDKMLSFLREDVSLALAFESADLLLPNAEAEGRQIKSDYRVTTPYSVVPNGVDPVRFVLSEGVRDIDVLAVGRFEPHKNQLGLIRALAGSGLRVTLVGPMHPHHPKYYARCLREAANAGFAIEAPRGHDELVSLYQSAKVHALASWFESTGLVSLEAALSGCNVVTTARGYTRDYFAGAAWFCDPQSPDSILQACLAARSSPWSPVLRERVLNCFTWEAAGRASMAAYERVLDEA